jgi:hypothetical protein
MVGDGPPAENPREEAAKIIADAQAEEAELMTLPAAATELGVSLSGIRWMIKANRLERVKMEGRATPYVRRLDVMREKSLR